MKFSQHGSRWLALAGAAGLGSLLAAAWMNRAGAGGIPTAPTLHYSGTLTDAGVPVNGVRPVNLSLWTAEVGGIKVCEKVEEVTVSAGRFRVALGDDCLAGVRANPNLWVEPIVGDTSFGRKKLGAVPYAVEAERARAADTVPLAGVTGVTTTTEWPGTVPANRVTDLKSVSIQSGVVSLGGTMTGWTLAEGEGERRFAMRVNFTGSFPSTPVVQTMFNFVDGTGPSGFRMDAKPLTVDPDGFTLQVRTWADSIVHGLRVVWIAYY
jgi:hypothetical protein